MLGLPFRTRSHGLDDTYLSLFSALACLGFLSPSLFLFFPPLLVVSVYFLVFLGLGFFCYLFITPAASGSGVL